jgi:hypothetical protein
MVDEKNKKIFGINLNNAIHLLDQISICFNQQINKHDT